MKIKHVMLTLGLAAVLGLGVGVGLKAGQVKEAEAVSAGETVYLRISSDWAANSPKFAVYAFGGTADSKSFTKMTKVDGDTLHDVYKAVIPANNDTIIFTRHNPAIADNELGWASGNKWSQSGNLVLSESTSNLWINSNGEGAGSWASGTYSESATNLSLTFYASSAKYTTESNPRVSVWGNCITNPTATYPGNLMEKTTETVSFQDSTLYRHTIEYKSHMSDHSDININMIISNDGDDNKTSDISVIVDGAYYYPNDGEYWYNGHTASEDLGESAAVAFDVSETNICALSEEKALQLRTDLLKSNNATNLASTIWNAITYTEALKWIDKQCATPLNLSRSVSEISNSNNTLTIAIVAVSAISLLAVGGFFFIRKRKEER